MFSENFDFENDIQNQIYENINGYKLNGWSGENRDFSERIFYYQFKGETMDSKEIIKSNYFTVINK